MKQSLGIENQDLQNKFKEEISQIKTKHSDELLKLRTEFQQLNIAQL